MARPLMIVGAFPRAAAASAVRAGFDPWCCGLQLTRDLEAFARTQTLPPGSPGSPGSASEYPMGLLKRIEEAPLPADTPVMITGGLENYPDLLEAIAFTHPLFGSGAAAIAMARDPKTLGNLPAHAGIKHARVHESATLRSRAGQWFSAMLGGRGYMIKPRASFGGAGVEMWRPAQSVGADQYLQQFIKGTPIGVVYRGDGWSCHLVGATEQIIGESAFGAEGFRYVGNVGPIHLSDTLRRALMHLGVSLTQQCDLRGVFGVDAIMDFAGNVWPIEVNPRYVDSVEVLERARQVAILAGDMLHDDRRERRDAARHGAGGPGIAGRVSGKAIVRVRRDVRAGDLQEHFAEGAVADVPRVGQMIRKGQRLCTVFASGATVEACRAALREAARVAGKAIGD